MIITPVPKTVATLTGLGLTQYASLTGRFMTVKIADDGEVKVYVHGPNGGLLADLQNFADADLEKFALDILQALHDKRGAS